MIIDCPQCQTRFVLADATKISASQRIRCARCGHQWRHGDPAVADRVALQMIVSRPPASIAALPKAALIDEEDEQSGPSLCASVIVLGAIIAMISAALYFKADIVAYVPDVVPLYDFLPIKIR